MLFTLVCLTVLAADADDRRDQQRAAIIKEMIERTQKELVALTRQLAMQHTPRLTPDRRLSRQFADLDTRVPVRGAIDAEWDSEERIRASIAAHLRRIEELGKELGRLEPEEDIGIPPAPHILPR